MVATQIKIARVYALVQAKLMVAVYVMMTLQMMMQHVQAVQMNVLITMMQVTYLMMVLVATQLTQ